MLSQSSRRRCRRPAMPSPALFLGLRSTIHLPLLFRLTSPECLPRSRGRC